MSAAPLGPGEIADLTLIFFAGVFATVGIAALFAYLGERARVRLAAKLLEQHQPLPPALFDRRARTELVRGVVLVAGGVGIALYFLLGDDPELARAGLVPGALGGGYLLGYLLERRHDR